MPQDGIVSAWKKCATFWGRKLAKEKNVKTKKDSINFPLCPKGIHVYVAH